MDSEKRKMIGAPQSLQWMMVLPLALLLMSVVSSAMSYGYAKSRLTADFNKAIAELAMEKADYFTSPDTIAALKQMKASAEKPYICRADGIGLAQAIHDKAFYAVALIRNDAGQQAHFSASIESDSFILVPQNIQDECRVQIRGFATCSMASVFSLSDQTLPCLLLMLSLLSFLWMIWKNPRFSTQPTLTLSSIKLTPMQRQLVQMLLDAPECRVKTTDICAALWGNKDNAEESLYTLVRRTKAALAEAGAEIVCNRGDSYQLRIRR
ncbi:MAG: helix-turn-helix domain-containing protein [Bacteroidales bacterium]|nr:helix-turn-helix domain-containing protein [Bacteroidales bacterium]